MPVEIIAPESGEGVHEVTLTTWLKDVGDAITIDEPLYEIMTEKVNFTIDAPTSGTLVAKFFGDGSDIAPFTIVGLIEEDAAKAKELIEKGVNPADYGVEGADPQPTDKTESKSEPAAKESAKEEPAREEPAATQEPVDDGSRKFYTPAVRAIAKDEGISEAELGRISGSGHGGRVTKKDLESYLANRSIQVDQRGKSLIDSVNIGSFGSAPSGATGEARTEKLAGMRKMIADAMERGHQVPVVSTLIEVDVTKLVDFRNQNKQMFEDTYGVRLTFTPFFIKATTESLLEYPYLNASLSDDKQISIHGEVNMGVAVSLGEGGKDGLIVPVIKNCESKSLVDISRDLEVIAKKARSNDLETSDVMGGTFTLTNPGSYGAVLGTPMITSTQTGILGTYGINKRAVVIDDMIAIRSIMNLVLTYDHRIVDGLQAGQFLQALKKRLENVDFLK